MTGPQLATLSTIAWVILTLAILLVFGSWSAGGSWTILPGVVRGVRDWAAEHAATRQASPSPWAVTTSAGPSSSRRQSAAARPVPEREPAAGLDADPYAEPSAETPVAEIEELWSGPLRH